MTAQKSEHRPVFSVTAEGKDITRALVQGLTEFTLTDYGGATAKADELKITLLSDSLTLPSKGARLRVALGFNDTLTDKGVFVVCTVASSGPPRRIEIYATAAPMNAEKHPGDVLSQKTRSWDNLKLADIVRTIATEHGLVPEVADALAQIPIGHLDQVAESDASLLTRLARSYDAISKPTGGFWLFLQQGAKATVSGRPLASVTLTPGDVSAWSYSEGVRGAATGKEKSTGGERKNSGAVTVRYYDETDGRTKTVAVDHDGPSVASPWTQSSRETAAHQAKAGKTQAQRKAQTMTLSGPCRPSLIPLTAEAAVITSGFGVREDRHWVVESLAFTLSPSGFSYRFNLVTDIHPPARKTKNNTQPEGPDYFG